MCFSWIDAVGCWPELLGSFIVFWPHMVFPGQFWGAMWVAVAFMVVFRVSHRSNKYHGWFFGLGPGPLGPALMVVVRIPRRSSIYHACTLGQGLGPMGPEFMVVVRVLWCL